MKLSRKLFAYYYEILFAHTMTTNNRRRFIPDFDEATPTVQKQFLNAAKSCKQLEADPKEYIKAQWDAFTLYSRARKRPIYPQPHQLFGVGAQTRYAMYHAANTQEKAQSEASQTVMTRKFFREERKLKGLVRVLRLPESDVLAEKPEEFSKEFLEHQGVWPLVRKKFHAQS